jgi:hypothetical protein
MKRYSAYVLTNESRKELLQNFHPKFSKVVAHHITVKFDWHEEDGIPPLANVKVVGYANDPSGVEALVVSINGTIQRPHGGTYHITLSLAPGRKPVESNDIISRGWKPVIVPFKIIAYPQLLP